jgi:hypothetical protein
MRKERHGCLTAWLIAMAVMSIFAAIVYLVAAGFFLALLPEASTWMICGLAALAIINIGLAIALSNWKKWGFWAYCATSAAAFAINLAMGTGLGPSFMGLLGVVILFVALQIGGARKGWPQLE